MKKALLIVFSLFINSAYAHPEHPPQLCIPQDTGEGVQLSDNNPTNNQVENQSQSQPQSQSENQNTTTTTTEHIVIEDDPKELPPLAWSDFFNYDNLTYDLGISYDHDANSDSTTTDTDITLDISYTIRKYKLDINTELDKAKHRDQDGEGIDRDSFDLTFTNSYRINDYFSASNFFTTNRYKAQNETHHQIGLGGVYHINQYVDLSVHYVSEKTDLVETNYDDKGNMTSASVKLKNKDFKYDLNASYDFTNDISISATAALHKVSDQTHREKDTSYTASLTYRISRHLAVSLDYDQTHNSSLSDKHYNITLHYIK